jgi:hypothetical protein
MPQGIGKLFFHQRHTNAFAALAAWNHLQPGGVNQAESLSEISMFKTVTVAVLPVASSRWADARRVAAPRALTGGTGGGALLGAVAGFNPLVGAVVGGAGGGYWGRDARIQ